KPLLRVPGGVLLDATARPAIASGRLIEGPEILPGWNIVLSVQPGALLEPLVTARIWLYVAAAAIL
ncbi:MAG TPA: two-component sensor histidine kinase, partial [Pseudomonas sp.]|nr:two-component sensor histidine kinase [Pseudomonas sp.]